MRLLGTLCCLVLLLPLSGCDRAEKSVAEEDHGKTRSPEEGNLQEPSPDTSKGLPAPTTNRTVVITLADDGFKVGDQALYLGSYTQTGARGRAGLSSDLRDAVLDLSSLKPGQWVPIAMQDGGGFLAIVCAEAPRIVITADGLVYPEGATAIQSSGPFVRLKLYDHDREQIDPLSVGIRIVQGEDVIPHTIEDDLVVASAATEEGIRLFISAAEDTLKFVMYPFLRGAIPNVVAYNVYSVGVGERLSNGD